MTPTEIKIKLIQRGITQTMLAEKWGRPLSTVSMVVNKKMRSRNLERKLARAIGVSVKDLRGERAA
jgi:hypothetical protein